MERCKCGGRLFIRTSYEQQDESGKYLIQELACCNKDCENYNQTIDTVSHKLE